MEFCKKLKIYLLHNAAYTNPCKIENNAMDLEESFFLGIQCMYSNSAAWMSIAHIPRHFQPYPCYVNSSWKFICFFLGYGFVYSLGTFAVVHNKNIGLRHRFSAHFHSLAFGLDNDRVLELVRSAWHAKCHSVVYSAFNFLIKWKRWRSSRQIVGHFPCADVPPWKFVSDTTGSRCKIGCDKKK